MARSFSGTGQYIEMSNSGAPALTLFTISLWIKAASLPGSYMYMVNRGDTGEGELNYYFRVQSDGSLLLGLTTGLFSYSEVQSASSLIAANTLYHVVARYNGTSIDIFLDGVSVASTPETGTPSTSLSDPRFRIGANSQSTAGNLWNGELSEVAIYDVGLTDTEIVSLAKKADPRVIRPVSLAGYWPLIGRYSPEIDLVGGNNGTLTGPPTNAVHPSIFRPRRRGGVQISAGAAASDISGSSSGVATTSASLVGLGALSGAISGIGATSGAMLAIMFASGAASGVGTVSGSLNGYGALSGLSNGIASVSAALVGLGALSGLSQGLATVTGSILNEFISGLSEGFATTSATLTALGALTGSSDGLASVQALLNGIAALSGTSTGQSTVTALLNGLASLSGSSDGVATVAAALMGLGALSGSSAGVATTAGNLLNEFIQGLAQGLATVSGTLTGLAPLSGASNGLASTLGALTGLAALSGQSSAVATADGVLVGLGSLAGLVSGQTSVSGLLGALAALSGSSDGTSMASGYLSYEGEVVQVIHTIAFSSKPFGIVYFIPKPVGTIKVRSF